MGFKLDFFSPSHVLLEGLGTQWTNHVLCNVARCSEYSVHGMRITGRLEKVD